MSFLSVFDRAKFSEGKSNRFGNAHYIIRNIKPLNKKLNNLEDAYN